MADNTEPTQQDLEQSRALFQKVHARLRQGHSMSEINKALENRGYSEGLKSLVEHMAGADHSQDPNKFESFAGSLLDSASFGMGKRIGGLAEGAGAAARGGSFKDAYTNYLREYEQGLSDLHTANPKSALAGDITGAVATGALIPAGGGGSIIPRLLKGAGAAAAMSGAQAVGHAKDLTNPADLAGVGVQTALGGALGLGLGVGGAAYTRLGSPGAYYLQRALSIAGDKVESNLARIHPDLPKFGFEASKKLGNLVNWAIRQHPDAAEAVAGRKAVEGSSGAIESELNRVSSTKQAMQNHPQTGYDAIFAGKTLQDPAAAQIMKDWAGWNPTQPVPARLAYDMQNQLESSARSDFAANRLKIRDVKLPVAHAKNEAATALKQIINNEIPEASALDAQTAPYIQRETQLARALKRMNAPQRGSAGASPATRLLDKGLDALGMGGEKAKARAAADILSVAARQYRSAAELKNATEGLLPAILRQGQIPGSGAGVAGAMVQPGVSLMDQLQQPQQQQQ